MERHCCCADQGTLFEWLWFREDMIWDANKCSLAIKLWAHSQHTTHPFFFTDKSNLSGFSFMIMLCYGLLEASIIGIDLVNDIFNLFAKFKKNPILATLWHISKRPAYNSNPTRGWDSLLELDGMLLFHKNFNISVKYYVKYKVKALSYFSSLFNDYFTINHSKNKSLTVKCLRVRFTICPTLNAHYDKSCRAFLYYCWK